VPPGTVLRHNRHSMPLSVWAGKKLSCVLPPDEASSPMAGHSTAGGGGGGGVGPQLGPNFWQKFGLVLLPVSFAPAALKVCSNLARLQGQLAAYGTATSLYGYY
jgi:hypothetical protein